MYSREQLKEAYLTGAGVGLACGINGLDLEATGRYARARMDEMLDRFVAPELRADDRVEAIL